MISGTLKKYILSRITPARARTYSSENTQSVAIPTGTAFTKYVPPNLQIGEFKNITYDSVNIQAVIKKKGVYFICRNFCSRADVNNITVETCVLINGQPAPSLRIKRIFSGSSTLTSASISGLVNLNKGDTLSVGVRHNNGGTVNFTTEFSNLAIFKI